MVETELYLPINPFTRRQGEVLLSIANGKTMKETAYNLKIKTQTVKTILYGLHNTDRHHIGVFGRVEGIVGYRINSKTELINILTGDVLLWKSNPENGILNDNL